MTRYRPRERRGSVIGAPSIGIAMRGSLFIGRYLSYHDGLPGPAGMAFSTKPMDIGSSRPIERHTLLRRPIAGACSRVRSHRYVCNPASMRAGLLVQRFPLACDPEKLGQKNRAEKLTNGT
jgi:hypothetical protein